ncbi:hypothetical protein GII30_19800 [Gordonia amarae]|uniref:Uncharacterized protein n=2 Tax=Gordonia amarae TaxID=36821 RepID=A0A857KP73_9ACTN|nr:hypothetical protein [Gordonia amarae]MCS3880685.1 hypothetical protein [Gordonia amarae]QHN18982.1 hypothetical protein GII35_20155 [Gordonia amarae]QHN23457.1 hypothetical protein GII34_19655 [Gordonia amarae]QHN32357.1 hypothetical protein GII32_19970 [Gordonia amarae]QHN41105.1 hypothetical protein GII30_19800 [Gordonia amarae]
MTTALDMCCDDDRLAVFITDVSGERARAHAEQLAAEGYLLVVGAADAEIGDGVADRIRETGGAAFGVQLDMCDMASVGAAVETAQYLAGAVDAVIHYSPATSDEAHHLAACLAEAGAAGRRHELLLVEAETSDSGADLADALHEWSQDRSRWAHSRRRARRADQLLGTRGAVTLVPPIPVAPRVPAGV